MADLPRSHLIAYALVALAVAAFAVRQLARGGGPTAARAGAHAAIRLQSAAPPGSTGPLVVHVAGAVRRPGVYRLSRGARVDDAVRRAGGARPRADLTQVNLAARLEDGRQVLVPTRTPAPAGGGALAGDAPAGPVNLNTATAEQLDTLDGVGPATARKILSFRQEHGGFSSVEELGQIPGIGDRRLAALRERVTV